MKNATALNSHSPHIITIKLYKKNLVLKKKKKIYIYIYIYRERERERERKQNSII